MRALVATLLLVAGCVDTGDFECDTDVDCVTSSTRGFCEPTHFCTFEDAACDSGWRYGESSGALSSTCLDSCVVEVSAGYTHTCIRQSGGAISCWGRNEADQLGNDGDDRSGPTPVGSLANAGGLDCGLAFSCVRTTDAKVACWGNNEEGELGAPPEITSRASPALIPGLSGVIKVSAGGGHACAVVAGKAWCWGDNSAGQLADEDVEFSAVPLEVDLDGVVDVVTGDDQTCALDRDGHVWCWGEGADGELGDGMFEASTDPVRVPLPVEVASIAGGGVFTCAVGRDGSLWCWGANDRNQLGIAGEPTGSPVRVPLDNVRAVAAGGAFACALKRDRSVWCWGDNTYAQLGKSTAEVGPNQITIADFGNDVVELSLGATHACARGHTGRIACWGDARNGKLGDGNRIGRGVPQPAMIAGATAIALGADHSCALVGPAVWCWGDNETGQLGDSGFVSRSVPAMVPNLDAIEIAAGEHTCARLTDNTVKCWGDNSEGELGIPQSDPVAMPGLVVPGIVAEEIAVGDAHSCARDASGTVWCWGDSFFGQLGSPVSTTTPIAVPLGGNAAIAIAAGTTHTCAIVTGGAVWCWGDNDVMQLGSGAAGDYSPRQVPLTTAAVELAVGGSHGCIRDAANAVWCWGSDERGELGDGSAVGGGAPVLVTSLPADIVELAAGFEHTCARSSDGSVRCWGADGFGQLGDNGIEDQEGPVKVMISDATAIAAGDDHTCALVGTGELLCWGTNGNGQLGDGTPISSATPVDVATSCTL